MNSSPFDSTFFTICQDGDYCFAKLMKDQLTEDENLEQLGNDFNRIIESLGCRKIICDLESVRYMTSGAIGKFIALHRRLVREDGQLVICQLQPTVRDILATSHLLQYFVVAESSDDAKAAMN